MKNRAIITDKITPDVGMAFRLFIEADAKWSNELLKEFGARGAVPASHEEKGKGEPGSALRLAYEARKAALERWHALKNTN